MSKNFKAYLKTPKGKLTAALSVLAVVWLVLLINYAGGISSFLPNQARDNKALQDLRRQQSELRKAEKEYQDFLDAEKAVNLLVENAWQESKHGMVDTILRQNIQNAADSSMIQLNTLGAVKTSRINDDFYFAELDLNYKSTFSEMLNFMAKLQEMTPKVYWKQFSIRPDARSNRKRATTMPSITSMLAIQHGEELPDQMEMNFSGTLRLIGFDGDPKKPLANSTKKGKKN